MLRLSPLSRRRENAGCCDCKTDYVIQLGLREKTLFCYKCGVPLNQVDLDMERIAAANRALQDLAKKYQIEPDGDGLVITPLPLIIEPIFAQS